MNIFLRLLQLYFPGFIKKKKLEQLFTITARAFGCEAPQTRELTYEQCLQKYALFTKQQTEIYIKEALDIASLKERLYQEAYMLGQELQKEFRIADFKEVILMMRVIYNMLGIDLRSNSENEITIKQCFFSQYYSPEICQVISSLDAGIAAGLSGGVNLCFYQRITEGNSCCRATFAR